MSHPLRRLHLRFSCKKNPLQPEFLLILSSELAQHQLGVGEAEWLTIAEPQLGSADNAGSGLL